MAMYGKLPGRPAGPPIDYTPTIHRQSVLSPPRSLLEKRSLGIIGIFSNKEWATEGAYVGHVDENGCFSLRKTRFALIKMSIPSLKIDQ